MPQKAWEGSSRDTFLFEMPQNRRIRRSLFENWSRVFFIRNARFQVFRAYNMLHIGNGAFRIESMSSIIKQKTYRESNSSVLGHLK